MGEIFLRMTVSKEKYRKMMNCSIGSQKRISARQREQWRSPKIFSESL
jgi:hypothetical protein